MEHKRATSASPASVGFNSAASGKVLSRRDVDEASESVAMTYPGYVKVASARMNAHSGRASNPLGHKHQEVFWGYSRGLGSLPRSRSSRQLSRNRPCGDQSRHRSTALPACRANSRTTLGRRDRTHPRPSRTGPSCARVATFVNQTCLRRIRSATRARYGSTRKSLTAGRHPQRLPAGIDS